MSAQVVVVMGVSGSGKTTVGQALAAKLGWKFEDGDSWHPEANVDKMSRGIPLNDDDRLHWLCSLSGLLARWVEENTSGVLACSALKRKYRDILTDRQGASLPLTGCTTFVLLNGEFDVLRQRMEERGGHFMPPGLLQSQVDALEMPSEAEKSVICSVTWTVEDIVERVIRKLQL